MSRQVISISISDELADRMLDHLGDSGYQTVSEYIRELVRNDLRQNGDPQAMRLPPVSSRYRLRKAPKRG